MYELLILGSGPAGLAAAIYAARYKMKAITIGERAGGAIAEAHLIENYPGVGKISGSELGEKMYSQAKNLGAEILIEKVVDIKKNATGFEISTRKEKYLAKRIMIAIGCERTRLGIPGEEEFKGKGVCYCATCDGFFFRKKKVAVIGGGDSAVTAALYLADIAEEVTVISRSESLKAEPHWIHKLEATPNIKLRLNSCVARINGNQKMTGLVFADGETVSLDGVFIEIGSNPNEYLMTQLGLNRDDKGYISVDDDFRTNVEGVWAAGDVTFRKLKLRQVVTSAAEGALAAYGIFLDVKKN